LSKIQADATTGQVVGSHPVVKVARQVDGFSSVQQASPMFFIQELCDKIIADHWHVITVANCSVLNLGDVNLLLSFALLILVPLFTQLFSDPLLLLLLLLLLLKFTQDLVICLVDTSFQSALMSFNPSVFIDALAIQNNKPHNCPVVRLIHSFTHLTQVEA
jgi:hypothetical protein